MLNSYVPRKRAISELHVHDGEARNFEWYWGLDGQMRGLDAFETIATDDQDDFLSRLEMWGDLSPGSLPSKTQINVENSSPLILAIKAGKYRFPTFRADGTNTWIITEPYTKQSQKRDKRGDAATARTIKEREDYGQRTKEKRYYRRAGEKGS
jgi:hypothetical protein